MKIVIVNTFEASGGAAIAANRLIKSLIKENISAKMLVRDKQTPDVDVISINNSWINRKLSFVRFIFERFVIYLNNSLKTTNLFKVSIANSGTNISRHPLIVDADIIHLHWINQGFLSLKNIQQLVKLGKPIVWTMHDMWACTGICHHSRTCNNFIQECGNCFFLQSTKANDLSHQIWLKKQRLYSNSNFTFICCSDWLSSKAKLSSLLKIKNVVSIPNSLDTSVFKIVDKEAARMKLSLPKDKLIILFVAFNVNDKRKGLDYLVAAIKILKKITPKLFNKIELVVVGNVKEEIENLFDIPIHALGYLSDTISIVQMYNAVDLFVTPSLEENLPNTIMESMACGTPCVGFNIGGIPEMIDHKENGYIVTYESAEDFAKGIHWVLFESDYRQLSENARKKITNTYSEKIIAKQHIELYEKLHNKR